jgi:hypothetical protein
VPQAILTQRGDERHALHEILTRTPHLTETYASSQVTVIGDKNCFGKEFGTELSGAGIVLLRPQRKGEKPRSGSRLFKPLRQIVESVNDTLKGQLTWNSTADAPPPESTPESPSASSP